MKYLNTKCMGTVIRGRGIVINRYVEYARAKDVVPTAEIYRAIMPFYRLTTWCSLTILCHHLFLTRVRCIAALTAIEAERAGRERNFDNGDFGSFRGVTAFVAALEQSLKQKRLLITLSRARNIFSLKKHAGQ